jgi:hypothetical protein
MNEGGTLALWQWDPRPGACPCHVGPAAVQPVIAAAVAMGSACGCSLNVRSAVDSVRV